MVLIESGNYFLDLSKKIFLELDSDLIDLLVFYSKEIQEDLSALKSLPVLQNPIFYCNPNISLGLSEDFVAYEVENFEILKSLTNCYEFSNIVLKQKEKVSG